jgi:hypothetical protein
MTFLGSLDYRSLHLPQSSESIPSFSEEAWFDKKAIYRWPGDLRDGSELLRHPCPYKEPQEYFDSRPSCFHAAFPDEETMLWCDGV